MEKNPITFYKGVTIGKPGIDLFEKLTSILEDSHNPEKQAEILNRLQELDRELAGNCNYQLKQWQQELSPVKSNG